MNSMNLDSPATPSMAITHALAEDNDIAPVSTEQPNKRSRKKSIVWDHFTIETVGPDCTRASCNHCKKSFAYITGSKLAGTSHLKRHIDLGICPASHQKNEDSQHISGVKSEPPPKRRRYRTSPAPGSIPFDQDRCNRDVAKMIIQHEYPLQIVEQPGFVEFVRSLQPQYNMASFDTIQGEIVAMYLREKQGLSDLISGLPGRVSVSLDLMTSNLDVGYGFLTGHFIDNDWKLHHRILNVVMLPFPKSEYAFNQAVVSCISDWHLENRLFTLTLDRSISNENIIGNLRPLLSVKNQFMFNGQLVKRNCYARVLTRLAQDALQATDEVLKRMRESVKYVKTSDSRDEKFSELRRQLQVPSTRDLIIDDKTKWDTTYHMLVAACELKEVFSCLDTTDPVYKINPSVDDWKQVEILCTYLKLLYDAASILTGPVYPPANLFYHEVSKIQLELCHAAESEDPFVSNLVRPLKERFDEYWRDCFLVLAIAVVMDPRFKMKLVEFSFSRIFGEDAGMWIKIVDDGIHELFLDYNLSVQTTFMDVENTSISHSDIFQEENHHVDVSAQQLDSQPNGESAKDTSSLVMNHYEVAKEVPSQDMHTANQADKRSVEAKEVNCHVEATQEMNGQAEMESREAKEMEEIHNTAEVPVQEHHIEGGSVKEKETREVDNPAIPTEDMHASGKSTNEMHGQEVISENIRAQEAPGRASSDQTESREMQHQRENGEMQTQHLRPQDLHFEGVEYCDQDQQAMYNQEYHETHTQDFPQLSVGDGLLDFEVYISETSNSLHLKSELDQYLEESLFPRVQDFDVLGWWRLNKLKYPTLSKMAADILSIPISTVAPESVFDTGSRKIDSYRSSLQPVTLEALVCARDWLRYGSSDLSSLDAVKMEH